MSTLIHQRVDGARAGTNPTVTCRMPSGLAVLCDLQFLRGYSILLPDPVVLDLNALERPERMQYLLDMTILGDALAEITGAYRINYEILGNLEMALHAHVIPRYWAEPESLRIGPACLYDKAYRESMKFEYERDRELMQRVAEAVWRRLQRRENPARQALPRSAASGAQRHWTRVPSHGAGAALDRFLPWAGSVLVRKL